MLCLHFQVDMARGLYLLSLVLMLFLLSHILAQQRRGSYKEKIREKMEERYEKRERREEKKEALGWRRRKRSVHGMIFISRVSRKESCCWMMKDKGGWKWSEFFLLYKLRCFTRISSPEKRTRKITIISLWWYRWRNVWYHVWPFNCT